MKVSLLLVMLILFFSGFAQAAAGDLDSDNFNSTGSGGVVSGVARASVGDFLELISNDTATSLVIDNAGKIIVAGYFATLGLLLSNIAYVRYLSDGSLDTTFGNGGVSIHEISVLGNDFIHSIALQVDGKIVGAGTTPGTLSSDVLVMRLNADGLLDTAGFNSPDGYVAINSGGLVADEGRGIAIDNNGKIVIVGSAGTEFLLMRLNSNGTLDTSLQGTGIVTTDVGILDVGRAVVIQPNDNKIILVGNSAGDFSVLRYNDDGLLDGTFGVGGVVTTDFGFITVDVAHAVALQEDGKIVVAGVSNNMFAVARYLTDGTLDTTFGSGGLQTTNIGLEATANGLAIQTDGKIVLAGVSDGSVALARYTISGVLDSTFGSGGIVTTIIGPSSGSNDVALQTDGKIVVAGTTNTHNVANSDFLAARYLGSIEDLSTCKNCPIKVNVLSLVSPGTGEELVPSSLVITEDPDNGTATVNTCNGIIMYTPDMNFVGDDIFAFEIQDTADTTITGSIFISVQETIDIGSDTAVEAFDDIVTFTQCSRVANFACLHAGFTFTGQGISAVWDSCFPIEGELTFGNNNTLALSKDLIMHNVSSIANLGNIHGKGHAVSLAKSVSCITTVTADGLDPASAMLCDVDVCLSCNLKLDNAILEFAGNSVLNGNGMILTLEGDSQIVVTDCASLLIKNLTLKGLKGVNVRCLDALSRISLQDVIFMLDDNYTFTVGSFDVLKEFTISGGGNTFSYQTDRESTVEECGKLIVDEGVTFDYNPSAADGSLLNFATRSSQLILRGATLHSTTTGLRLTRGTLGIDGSTYLESDATVESESIVLGDGTDADNDMRIRWLADSGIELKSGRLLNLNITGS